MSSRKRQRPRRRWIAPVAVWTLAVLAAAATWALRVPAADALADDPRVGAGLLALPEVAAEPSAVLPSLTPSPGPDAAALASRLAAVPRDGVTDVVAYVADGVTGEELYRSGQGARTPASSMKVLTSVAALDVLGGDRTFATSTLLAADGGLVLRGGGDPLLSAETSSAYPQGASLQELAAHTAAELRADGVAQVTVDYDATLFAGPAWNPDWTDAFRTSVAPVSALLADHGRIDATGFERHGDPARAAADRFAALLSAQGMAATIRGPVATPPDARLVAVVESPPVSTIVEQVLLNSDNDAAEALARHVAIARGRPATPADAAEVLAQELQSLGLWADGMLVGDGSGISSRNAVTADALARALALGVDEARFRPVLTGLPVAGVTGTLGDRFEDEAALAGRGVVRAKTGTIRGVNSLTGYVVTEDGRPLVFAFLLNGGSGQTSARTWLDRATAQLAACGC